MRNIAHSSLIFGERCECVLYVPCRKSACCQRMERIHNEKLKQVLVRFLVECEYLESSKSQTLLPVYLYPELDELIRSKGDTDALAAFNCFN